MIQHRYKADLVHNCTITPNSFLAKVECHSGHCSVSRVKKLAYQTSEYLLDAKIWGEIAKDLPKSINGSNSVDYGSSTRTERYLYDPFFLYDGPELIDVINVSLSDFSKRFATILNIYYQASISPELRRGFLGFGQYHNEPRQQWLQSTIYLH